MSILILMGTNLIKNIEYYNGNFLAFSNRILIKKIQYMTTIKIIIFANIKNTTMSLFRVILAIFFPPLAVIDKGCGSILIVFLLTLCAWAPGIIGALVILNKN